MRIIYEETPKDFRARMHECRVKEAKQNAENRKQAAADRRAEKKDA
jgi:hypothetical protein